MTIKKPLLAETAETLADIPLPCFASFKLDGIRCVKVGGKALSRSFKPIPNHFVRNWIEQNLPDGIDGEIMVPGMDFNSIQSAIMSEDGEPDFRFHAFDLVRIYEDCEEPLLEDFHNRYVNLSTFIEHAEANVKSRLALVEQQYMRHHEHVVEFEQSAFKAGAEGIMTRHPTGRYKCGRSTLKEAILLKYKRWVDEEATVIGFIEQMTNTNEKETNELGHSKRSKKKDGMVPANTLGAFVVKRANGQVFELGTGDGLTQELRKKIWDNQDEYLIKLVTFKHQVSPNDPPGMKPRFPSWKSFRSTIDISE